MAIKILQGRSEDRGYAVEYTNAVKKYNKAKCEQLGIDTADLEAKGYVAID